MVGSRWRQAFNVVTQVSRGRCAPIGSSDCLCLPLNRLAASRVAGFTSSPPFSSHSLRAIPDRPVIPAADPGPCTSAARSQRYAEAWLFHADWEYDAKARINGSVAIVDNAVLFDTFAGDVIALDVRTGHEIWKLRLDNVAMSTPIAAKGIVYVGTGANGSLYSQHRGFAYDEGVGHTQDVWGRRRRRSCCSDRSAHGSKGLGLSHDGRRHAFTGACERGARVRQWR